MTHQNAMARAISILVLTAAAALGGCASMQNTPATAAATIAQTADLSTFNTLAQQAGLGDVLNGPSQVTIFAPTNEAFAALPAATLDKLSKDPSQLKALLSYHIVSGNVLSSSIQENTSLPTIGGAKLGVSKAGDFVTVDDAMVSQADIKAANGVIHQIDRVLTPPAAKK